MTSPDINPTKRATTGKLHLIVGFLIIVVALIAIPGSRILRGYRVETDIVIAVLIVGVLCVPIGFAVIRKGMRLLQRNAALIMQEDPRPPVLYLRSFNDDDTSFALMKYKPGLAGLIPDPRAEEQIAPLLNCIGPMVAIGRPGEPLPETGASRLYVEDDQWKAKVYELMQGARLVVMLGRATTEGVHWEIQQVIANLAPEKLVFFFPFAGKKLDEQYASFKQSVQQYFPNPLPETIGNAHFLRFEANWTPHLVTASSKKLAAAIPQSLLALLQEIEPGFVEPPLRKLIPTHRLYLAYGIFGTWAFLMTLLLIFGIYKMWEIFQG